jgi:hypothetical protein
LKRRDFLAASALLSLLAPSSVLAANKKKSGTKRLPTSRQEKAVPERPAEPAPKPPPSPTAGPAARKGSRRYRPVVETPTASTAAMPSPPPAAVEQYNAISLPDEAQPQWRSYDITSTITLQNVKGKLRLWLPLAQYKDTSWQRSLGHNWRGNFDSAGIYRDPVAEMEVFYADWKEVTGTPQLQLVSQVAKQDRHFDITRRGSTPSVAKCFAAACNQATWFRPMDLCTAPPNGRLDASRIRSPRARRFSTGWWRIHRMIPGEAVSAGAMSRPCSTVAS